MTRPTLRTGRLPVPRAVISRHWVLAGLAVAGLLALTFLSARPPAAAQTEVKVMVTIYKVWERGCYGEDTFLGCVGGEDADFYSVTTVNGQEFETQQFEDQTSIEPNWQFQKAVAVDSLVPVQIQIYDYDSGLRGGDDHVDLTAGDGNDLNLTVVVGRDPGGCRVGGNFPGGTATCGQRLSDGGNNDEDAAGIEFSVDVVYPTRVGRTTVLCTHTPLWPQPGQAVTVNAQAMDIQSGTLSGGFGFPHSYTFNPVQVAKLQIWFSADAANPNRVLAGECVGAATAGGCQAVVNPTGAMFHYGCWVENPGVTVASNYRGVSVGAAAGANVVPVMFNQPSSKAVDVVLHPDQAYANGWTDAQFLQDAATMANQALAEPVWTQYQARINLWVSSRTGNPTWPATGTGSTTVSTIGLSDGGGKEAFAEAAGIVHRRQISDGATPPVLANTRDAASNGFFTINALRADSANVMRHEMGHAVFTLADEYCCDGGYFQQPENPDVYSSQANCVNDFTNLNLINTEFLWPTQGPCRSIPQPTTNPATATATPGPVPTPAWWVSDPSAFQSGATTLQDLMVGNDYGMTSDIRRFRWVLDQLCPEGGC